MNIYAYIYIYIYVYTNIFHIFYMHIYLFFVILGVCAKGHLPGVRNQRTDASEQKNMFERGTQVRVGLVEQKSILRVVEQKNIYIYIYMSFICPRPAPCNRSAISHIIIHTDLYVHTYIVFDMCIYEMIYFLSIYSFIIHRSPSCIIHRASSTVRQPCSR